MNKLEKEAIQTIAKHYGFDAQCEILIEECAELIKATQKKKRYPDSNIVKDDFVSELADVKIMTNQIETLLNDEEKTDLKHYIKNKLDRQLQRIADEKENADQ